MAADSPAAAGKSGPSRSFLRWAGSKRLLLEKLIPFFPKEYGHYIEPFVGGGSVFFRVGPPAAILGDTNRDLITTYAAVRDDVDRVISIMEGYGRSREAYYDLRDQTQPLNRWEVAARFVSLNKMCWNGLYRVNKYGKFNVPFGSRLNPYYVDKSSLRNASNCLKVTTLKCGDFQETLKSARAGDLVYLDPPYITGHANNGFAEYNSVLFGWEDQVRLALEFRRLVRIGAAVFLTNASHNSILDLYEGFNVVRFRRKSTISGDPKYRRRFEESLIWGSQ